MPNPDDFDPAKDINFDQDKARERVRRQKAAEEAEKQREEAEKQRAQAQHRANIVKLLRYADEQLEKIRAPTVSEFVVTETWTENAGIFRKHLRVHHHETRYYGLWLSLSSFSGSSDSRRGLVKLRRPRTGYAFMEFGCWDPREVGNITIHLTDSYGREKQDRSFQIFASLEEAAKGNYQNSSVEKLTVAVRQALNFVATGQPPEPTYIHNDYSLD